MLRHGTSDIRRRTIRAFRQTAGCGPLLASASRTHGTRAGTLPTRSAPLARALPLVSMATPDPVRSFAQNEYVAMDCAEPADLCVVGQIRNRSRPPSSGRPDREPQSDLDWYGSGRQPPTWLRRLK